MDNYLLEPQSLPPERVAPLVDPPLLPKAYRHADTCTQAYSRVSLCRSLQANQNPAYRYADGRIAALLKQRSVKRLLVGWSRERGLEQRKLRGCTIGLAPGPFDASRGINAGWEKGATPCEGTPPADFILGISGGTLSAYLLFGAAFVLSPAHLDLQSGTGRAAKEPVDLPRLP